MPNDAQDEVHLRDFVTLVADCVTEEEQRRRRRVVVAAFAEWLVADMERHPDSDAEER